jgi:hypothetical protein
VLFLWSATERRAAKLVYSFCKQAEIGSVATAFSSRPKVKAFLLGYFYLPIDI